jgi:hypothetical protein
MNRYCDSFSKDMSLLKQELLLQSKLVQPPRAGLTWAQGPGVVNAATSVGATMARTRRRRATVEPGWRVAEFTNPGHWD